MTFGESNPSAFAENSDGNSDHLDSLVMETIPNECSNANSISAVKTISTSRETPIGTYSSTCDTTCAEMRDNEILSGTCIQREKEKWQKRPRSAVPLNYMDKKSDHFENTAPPNWSGNISAVSS